VRVTEDEYCVIDFTIEFKRDCDDQIYRSNLLHIIENKMLLLRRCNEKKIWVNFVVHVVGEKSILARRVLDATSFVY
jgi:hypothetical protein